MVTIIIFMFVTTVCAAFLSMVTSNYYGRVSESRRAQNLYNSESGLDVTYNIISKTVEAANVYGVNEVKELEEDVKDMDYDVYTSLETEKPGLSAEQRRNRRDLYALYADIEYWKYFNGNLQENEMNKWMEQDEIDGKIEEDKEDIDKLIDKVFRDNFKDFIKDNLKTSIEESKYIKFEKVGQVFEREEEELRIGNAIVYMGKEPDDETIQEDNEVETENVKVATDGIADEDAETSEESREDDEVKFVPKGDEATDIDRTLQVESGYDEDKGVIEYEDHELEINFKNKEESPITVTSEFATNTSERNVSRIGENLRIIEANYSIRVPNYKEVAFKESIEDMDNDVNKIVGLTIGGDMDINGVNKLNVFGDIFVRGNEFNDTMDKTNRTFEKYSGGIILNHENGSKGIVNFSDNVFTRGTFNIKNNINSTIDGDLYARNIYAGDGNNPSEDSALTIGKEAVIDNDLTMKATDTIIKLNDFYGINEKNTRYENESVTNSNYINTTSDKGKERTSSSIIINGPCENSEIQLMKKAYIMGVAHINTEDGYQTGESIAVKGNEDANYKAYSEQVSGNDKFKYDSPLQVLDEWNVFKKANHFYNYWKPQENSVNSGGIIIPKESIDSNNIHSIGAIVYKESKDGTPKLLNSNYNLNDEEDVLKTKRIEYAKKIYKLGQIAESENEILELYNSIGNNADEVSGLLGNIYDYELEDKGNGGNEFAMFCESEDKTIVIKGKNSKESYEEDDDSVIEIDATNNKYVNAVIVTMGKVIIDGDVNFRGNIIANGNLEVLGRSTSTVNIRYDETITENIQKSNEEVFSDVFGGEKLENKTVDIRSNSSDFLTTKLWKIIQ